MYDLLDEFAGTWLDQVLWPIAMKAASLPLETTPEEVRLFDLPKFNAGDLADFVIREARGHCYRRTLFMAVILAAKLVATEQAEQMKAHIQALMWQDAVECAIANDLDRVTNQAGFPAADYRQRACLADDKWSAWEATDQPVKVALEAILSDYSDEMIWAESLDTLVERQQVARQMKADGRSLKVICKYTALSQDEVEDL